MKFLRSVAFSLLLVLVTTSVPFASAHDVDAPLVQESGRHPFSDTYFEVIYYSFKTDDEHNGSCTATSVGPTQFLTSAHCLGQVSNPQKQIRFLGYPENYVTGIQFIRGADAALVSVEGSPFYSTCVALSKKRPTVGQHLQLFLIDQQTGKVTINAVSVTDNARSAYNPVLGEKVDNLSSAVSPLGVKTQDGNSGSPLMYKNNAGDYVLAGIVSGLSERDGSILFEPSFKYSEKNSCS